VESGGIQRVVVKNRADAGQIIVIRQRKNLPGDGNTFDYPQVRIAFFKAALIASGLWSRRVYRDRLVDEGPLDVQLRRALGAFRKGVEEADTALDAGIAVGRAWLFFGKYLPARLPAFADAFRQSTDLTIEQYFICATWILRFSFPDTDGNIFPSEIGATHATWGKIFSAFLEQLSQDPESLAASVTDNDQTGYRSVRERPILRFSGYLGSNVLYRNHHHLTDISCSEGRR
jgi:hypothetical protein